MPVANDDWGKLDRNLALEVVRVTEAAALAASAWIGRGDEKAADQAAVDAMRRALNSLNISGEVVIGEGERDEAPMLYIGEKVGLKKGALWQNKKDTPRVDIALDPLEGTTITAKGGQNALAVIAMTEKGGFLNAPDVYMQKIACGPLYPKGFLDIDEPISSLLPRMAKIKGCKVDDLLVCVLDRDRHAGLITDIRKAGARISLIADGDVAGVITTAEPETGIDLYVGTGGAPEGVLAAAALRCVGGEILGRLLFRNEDELKRADRWGVKDLNKIYTTLDMASGRDVMFAATGVTSGPMLQGVRIYPGGGTTHSIVMRSKSGTIRRMESTHNFDRMPKAIS